MDGPRERRAIVAVLLNVHPEISVGGRGPRKESDWGTTERFAFYLNR